MDLLSLAIAGTLACGGQTPNACMSLDAEVRQALEFYVRANHATGTSLSEDQDELRWARSRLRERATEVLPCLVDIFHRGLGTTGLWPYGSLPPVESRWVISLIRVADQASAIILYREWRDEPTTDPLTRAHIAVELAALGENEFLPEVAAFLRRPHEVPNSDGGRVRPLQERAIEVISFNNYRPGLQALQLLYEKGPLYAKAWRWLPIYIAQLSGDHETVLKYAHDSELFGWALRALKRMGSEDILRSLATDPKYRYRSLARTLLEGNDAPAG